MIENIAPSYIQSAVLTQANIKSLNLDEKGVRPEDIKPILRKQRLSKIKMILNGLVKRKDSKKSRKQYEWKRRSKIIFNRKEKLCTDKP